MTKANYGEKTAGICAFFLFGAFLCDSSSAALPSLGTTGARAWAKAAQRATDIAAPSINHSTAKPSTRLSSGFRKALTRWWSKRAWLSAAQSGDAEKMKALLVYYPPLLEAANDQGQTALMIAAVRGILVTAKFLISAHANVDAKDANGWTALMYAAETRHSAVALALLEAGAEVNAKDGQGWTPLMIAAERGSRDIVQALIATHANVGASNASGGTALISAARHGYTGIVEDLIKAGADVNASDPLGWTALKAARVHGYRDTVAALRAAGAKG